jgi:hypothetical protein
MDSEVGMQVDDVMSAAADMGRYDCAMKYMSDKIQEREMTNKKTLPLTICNSELPHSRHCNNKVHDEGKVDRGYIVFEDTLYNR